MKNLNPYTIHWAIITADKGVVRKNDVITIDGFTLFERQTELCVHAPTKEKLIDKLNLIKGKLEKKYNVLIINDAQFEKLDIYSNDFSHYKAALKVASVKQKENIFILT